MIPRTLIPALALLMTAGSALMGQTTTAKGDVDFAFKPRYGVTFGNVKDDMGMDQMLGLGLQGRYAMSSTSWLDAELVYSYYPGKEYNATQYNGPTYGPNGTGYATTNASGTAYTLDPNTSIDSRKNHMTGFSLKFGYESMFATSWSWQAGLSLDMLQYTQEVSGTLKPVGAPTGYYEGLSYTPHKTSAGIGAYAGVKYMITPDFSLDFNAVTMGYKTQNYNPTTYTGQLPDVTSDSRHGFGIEVAFGLKL